MGNRRNPRRDIPYADRLILEKYRTIADQRDDAARTVLKLACVALNDTEGLGHARITKFALRLRELIDIYYADIERQEVHVNERLEKMGFQVVGKEVLVAFDENGKPLKGVKV